MRAAVLSFFLILSGSLLPAQAAESVIRPGDRVMFLGDSITMDGRYIAWLDLLLRTRAADPLPELINLGLASETLSGLSEKEHPWPRPCLFERLDRALEKVKPQVVIACYGMNDGIYAPPSDERRMAFENGCRQLSAKVRAAGAKLIFLTPPPFDAASFKGPLKDETADGEFGYSGIWKGYDKVLAGYTAFIKREPGLADRVFDLHTALWMLYDTMHAADKKWTSGDGIHPGEAMHVIIAGLLAEALELPSAPGTVIQERSPDGVYRFAVETALPLPAWRAAPLGLMKSGGFTGNANALKLDADLTAPVYRLQDGDRLLGIFSAKALSEGGMELTMIKNWPPARDAAELFDVAMKRHSLMSGAWLEHVGHTRPDTDRNFPPLEEARKQAAPMEALMREGAIKRKSVMKLEPVR